MGRVLTWLVPLWILVTCVGRAVPVVSAAPDSLQDAGGLTVGSDALVSGTFGDGLLVRAAPGLTGVLLAELRDGTQVRLLDGPVIADGYRWYRIRAVGQDADGWAAGRYLAPYMDETRRHLRGLWAALEAPPPAPIPPLDQAVSELVNPCSAVRRYLWERGLQPLDTGNPYTQSLLDSAWPLLLPVLRQVAANPSRVDSVRLLVDSQFDRALNTQGVYYSPADMWQAFLTIDDRAQRGSDARQRGDESVEPGVLLLAALWSEPERREAWRRTAYAFANGLDDHPRCS